MQVLVVLAGARGEVVSRDELVRRCWDGRIVGDDAINRVIARLRRLGDGPAQGSFAIETIVKVGYRLTERHTPAPTEIAPSSVPHLSRRAVLIGAGAATVAGGAGWWWFGSGADPAATMRERAVEAARLDTAQGAAQAVGFAQEAARLAPDDARNWGALAMAYHNGLYYQNCAAERLSQARLASAARRALALDRREVNARAALALALPRFGDWARAEQALRAVLTQQPGHLEVAMALSRLLSGVGRNRDALAILDGLQKQTALMPTAQYWRARLLWIVGRLDESDAVMDRAIRLWPRDPQIWFSRFWLLSHTGRADAALAMSAARDGRPIGIPAWNFELIDSSARALQTRTPDAIEAALRLNDAAAREGRGFTENAVELASAIGRVDTAFGYVDAYFFGRGFGIAARRYSVEQSEFTHRAKLQTKFLFTPPTRALRADGRFAELTRRIGLTDYWRTSGTRPDTA